MKLDIKNFRSIKDQSVELAPITVLYGPNGSGKSSLLYALLVMKNIILINDRESGDLFDLGFANLGDFRALIHGHQIHDEILFRIMSNENGYPVSWAVSIGNPVIKFGLRVIGIRGEQDILSLRQWSEPPFGLKGTSQTDATFDNCTLRVHWNGFCAEVKKDSYEITEIADKFNAILGAPVKHVRSVAIAPLQMAFSRGELSVATEGASLNSTLYFSEDEVGTLLATRRYLQTSVSKYLEKITNRTLRVFSPPGDTNYSIHVGDRNTGLETELVNDGYGVNRVAWLLALALHDETKTMCVEEPETHLHPTSIRKLTRAFVDIMRNEDKRFLLTTHSEALVLALLTEVSRKNLKPDEVAFYLTTKEGKETKFERQEVNELGQIDGGLTSFMEGELEDVAAFFGRTV